MELGEIKIKNFLKNQKYMRLSCRVNHQPKMCPRDYCWKGGLTLRSEESKKATVSNVS